MTTTQIVTITQLGYFMMMTPILFLGVTLMNALVYMMARDTINAYRDRNIALLVVMLFVWFFLIGTIIVVVGGLAGAD